MNYTDVKPRTLCNCSAQECVCGGRFIWLKRIPPRKELP